jgi:glycosyltransferase involved in cell wall biosynthesis
MKQKISAFVITKNEEKKIERCLQHLDWTDELIILDSNSTDKTRKIAKKFTKKMFKRSFTNYADQKQAAINKCTNEWVLEVDADEVITQKLKDEIQTLMQDPTNLNKHVAYKITRQEYFLKKKLMTTEIVRLYRKDKVQYTGEIHERLIVEGSIGDLKQKIIHESDKYETIGDRIKKINNYTTKEAAQLPPNKSAFWAITKMIIEPPIYAAWLYLGKGLWKKGKEGIIWCILALYYHFLIYAKYYEHIYKQKGHTKK